MEYASSHFSIGIIIIDISLGNLDSSWQWWRNSMNSLKLALFLLSCCLNVFAMSYFMKSNQQFIDCYIKPARSLTHSLRYHEPHHIRICFIEFYRTNVPSSNKSFQIFLHSARMSKHSPESEGTEEDWLLILTLVSWLLFYFYTIKLYVSPVGWLYILNERQMNPRFVSHLLQWLLVCILYIAGIRISVSWIHKTDITMSKWFQ